MKIIDPELLKILVCPESKQPLSIMDESALRQVNEKIRQGDCLNKAGAQVTEELQALLLREDGKFAYPVRGGIPVMLAEESLPIDL